MDHIKRLSHSDLKKLVNRVQEIANTTHRVEEQKTLSTAADQIRLFLALKYEVDEVLYANYINFSEHNYAKALNDLVVSCLQVDRAKADCLSGTQEQENKSKETLFSTVEVDIEENILASLALYAHGMNITINDAVVDIMSKHIEDMDIDNSVKDTTKQ